MWLHFKCKTLLFYYILFMNKLLMCRNMLWVFWEEWSIYNCNVSIRIKYLFYCSCVHFPPCISGSALGRLFLAMLFWGITLHTLHLFCCNATSTLSWRCTYVVLSICRYLSHNRECFCSLLWPLWITWICSLSSDIKAFNLLCLLSTFVYLIVKRSDPSRLLVCNINCF